MIFGVIASSISGAIRAIEAKMDITGAVLLAFIAACSGGTVRDLVLGSEIFWIKDQFYIWITLPIGAITYIWVYYKQEILSSKKLNAVLIITDAMGLAAFSLAGVEKSIHFGQNSTVAILMGVWSAIGGGIIADVISNRIPLVFSQELYISVSLIGSICYLVLSGHISGLVASMISAIIMILLRLYSVKFNWRLPIIYK